MPARDKKELLFPLLKPLKARCVHTAGPTPGFIDGKPMSLCRGHLRKTSHEDSGDSKKTAAHPESLFRKAPDRGHLL
jgi:hypothetical protein